MKTAQLDREELDKIADVIERSIVPRIARFHAPASERAAALAAASEDRASYAALLARLVLAEDEREAAGFIRALHQRGAPPEAIYLDLLAPAARVLGELWNEDEADVMRVTLGSARLQTAMRALSSDFVRGTARERGDRSILLTLTPGEEHVFGIEMTADFFRRAGWRVDLAPGLDAHEIAERCASSDPRIVGLSLGARDSFDSLRQTIEALKSGGDARKPLVIVGGAAFALHPELIARSGADAHAPDAAQAVEIAEDLLARYLTNTARAADTRRKPL